MYKIKFALFLAFVLLLFVVQPVFGEQSLEDASYLEGVKAITEMHVLNQLGIAGELISIYKALNQC